MPLCPCYRMAWRILEAVARELGVSQRTLARRLAVERLNFSVVLESLKIDLAQRYLADSDLSISQIAWLLGYQEVSSFTHAFKRWSGKTPRQARFQKTLNYAEKPKMSAFAQTVGAELLPASG